MRNRIQTQAPTIADRLSGTQLAQAIIGGVVAAVIGAMVWGLMAAWVDSEAGWLAMAPGVTAGFGVLFLSQRKQGVSLRVIAVGATLVGIGVGKYYIYANFLRDGIEAAFGPQAAAAYSLFSSATFNYLRSDTGSMFDTIDLLWVGLAVYFAWQIPQGVDLRLLRKLHVRREATSDESSRSLLRKLSSGIWPIPMMRFSWHEHTHKRGN